MTINNLFYGQNRQIGEDVRIRITNVGVVTRDTFNGTREYQLTVTVGTFEDENPNTPIANPIDFIPSVTVGNYIDTGASNGYNSGTFSSGQTTKDIIVLVSTNSLPIISFSINLSLDSPPSGYIIDGSNSFSATVPSTTIRATLSTSIITRTIDQTRVNAVVTLDSPAVADVSFDITATNPWGNGGTQNNTILIDAGVLGEGHSYVSSNANSAAYIFSASITSAAPSGITLVNTSASIAFPAV